MSQILAMSWMVTISTEQRRSLCWSFPAARQGIVRMYKLGFPLLKTQSYQRSLVLRAFDGSEYEDHATNEDVCAKIQQAIGPHVTVSDHRKERRKLQWYGHVSRSSGLAKPSCKALWKGKGDKADRERGGKTTSGNGQAWSSPSPRGQWRTGKKKRRKLVVESSVVPQRPSRLRDRWWWWWWWWWWVRI